MKLLHLSTSKEEPFRQLSNALTGSHVLKQHSSSSYANYEFHVEFASKKILSFTITALSLQCDCKKHANSTL